MTALNYRTGDFIPHNVAHMRTDAGEEYPIKAGCDMSVYFDAEKGSIVFDGSSNTREIDAVIVVDIEWLVNDSAFIYSPLFGTDSAHILGNMGRFRPRDDV